MRILAVESASSGFMKHSEGLLAEGFSMLKLISEGLQRSGNDVFTMLSDDARAMGEIGSEIIPGGDVGEVAKSLDVDYIFPIAPDAELAGLVEGLGSEGIRCISSDAESIRATADKLETCRRLRESGIDTPRIVSADEAEFPVIAKDRYGVACEGLRIVNNQGEIPSNSNIILQKFIRGEDVSVTLFSDGERAVPVSLNKQDIEFKEGKGTYLGGEVPFEHSLGEAALETAKRAAESIAGLKGCIGVDLVLAEKPCVIEINPRVTTSMVALELASGLNVGEAAFESFLGELPEQPKFTRKIRFRKEPGGLRFEEIK